ncbi:hypothetical protein OIDMADRAFT_126687 [Oidiodendron maius Zn]|uniref:Aminotransferase class III n=1 Tax=Oidiodendron maius (strain Zn) TaxID=913774 RepID=A0A0C3CK38_OIDMZ|nr:hypothetical protein OIDMADRAFT_126687 [Oidiodendron maius Zn]
MTTATGNGRITKHISSSVLYRQLRQPNPSIVSSKGCFLFADDGRQIIDASSGAAVSCIGHNDERLHYAILEQLKKVEYCYPYYFTTPVAEELSQVLTDSTGGKMSKVFIVSSGTEAVEAAIKMAMQYFTELPQPQRQRTRFIARKQSYHGNTLGSLSTGFHPPRRELYEAMLSKNVSHVSACYAYRGKTETDSDETYVGRLAQELEDEFQRVGPETVCAFVAETVCGTTLGSAPPVEGYFKAMKEVCERHGALLILDEVLSGMGRTGTLHAWQQEGIVPDLQTVAKGLGAGYASIGALLVHNDVVRVLAQGTGAFIHSQTYQSHPLACAAALEVQKILKEDDLLSNVRKQGALLGKLLVERLGNHPNVGDIRGRGLLWGIEFVKNKATKEPFPSSNKVSPKIHSLGLSTDHGICFLAAHATMDDKTGDYIALAPPYIVSEQEVHLMVDRTEKVLRAFFGY